MMPFELNQSVVKLQWNNTDDTKLITLVEELGIQHGIWYDISIVRKFCLVSLLIAMSFQDNNCFFIQRSFWETMPRSISVAFETERYQKVFNN
jgi:hypothetical protein